MALNFPGPYEARINYTVGIYQHTARLNFNAAVELFPGAIYDDIEAVNKGGTTTDLSSAVANYANAIKPFLSAANSEITDVEIWKITPESFQGVQVSSGALNVAGTSASGTAFGSQIIMSFRTLEGGILKASVMNSTTMPGATVLPSAFSTNLNIWADEFRLSTSPWLGRDTSYVSGVLRFLPGQNESLFKKIYRGV